MSGEELIRREVIENFAFPGKLVEEKMCIRDRCLAVLDYITGCIKAIYNKQLSSEIGFKGLLKKIVMFIVIAVAYAIQGLMGLSLIHI